VDPRCLAWLAKCALFVEFCTASIGLRAARGLRLRLAAGCGGRGSPLGSSLCCGGGGFVESAWLAFEGVDIDMDVDVWFLAAAGCRVGGLEERVGEFFEGCRSVVGWLPFS
jgi:hypothetical protein